MTSDVTYPIAYKTGLATFTKVDIIPSELANTIFADKSLNAFHEVIVKRDMMIDSEHQRPCIKLFMDIDFKKRVENPCLAVEKVISAFSTALTIAYSDAKESINDLEKDIVWFGRVPQSGPKAGFLSMHIFHTSTAIPVDIYSLWATMLAENMQAVEPELLTADVFDIGLVKEKEWYFRAPYSTKYASHEANWKKHVSFDDVLVHSSIFNELYTPEADLEEMQDDFKAHIKILKAGKKPIARKVREDIQKAIISDTSNTLVVLNETPDILRKETIELKATIESMKRERGLSGATAIAVNKMLYIISFLSSEVGASGKKIDHYNTDYNSDDDSEPLQHIKAPLKAGKRFFNDFHSKIPLVLAIRGHYNAGFLTEKCAREAIADILMLGVRYFGNPKAAEERTQYYWDISANADMSKSGLSSFVKAAKNVLPETTFAKMYSSMIKSSKDDIKSILAEASTTTSKIDMNENYDIDDFVFGMDCYGKPLGNDAAHILRMASKVITVVDHKYYTKKRIQPRPTEYMFELQPKKASEMKDFNASKVGIWTGADKPTEISLYTLFSENTSTFLSRTITFNPEGLMMTENSINEFNKPHFPQTTTDPFADERVQFLMNHFHENICSGDEMTSEYGLKWLHAVIINCEKLETSLFIQSDEFGTGKTIFFSNFLTRLIGDAWCKATNWKEIEAGNNSYAEGSLLVLIDEMPEGGNMNKKVAAALRSHSDRTVVVSEKYEKQKKTTHKCNYIYTTNHTDSIKISEGCRRFSCLKSRMPKAKDLSAYKCRLFELCDDPKNDHSDLPDLFIRALSTLAVERKDKWTGINIHDSLKNAFRTEVIGSKNSYQRFLGEYRGALASVEDIRGVPYICDAFNAFCAKKSITSTPLSNDIVKAHFNKIIPQKDIAREIEGYEGYVRLRTKSRNDDGIDIRYEKYEYVKNT